MAKEVDLNLLPHLHALLELRNVSRAADRTHLSQSAMSNALARLRRHFNDDLLVRVGRDYELTPLAQALQPQVGNALASVQNTMNYGAQFDPASSDRTFTLAASDYATTVMIGPLRRLMARMDTRVGVDIVPSSTRVLAGPDVFAKVDLVIAPAELNFVGESRLLFRDEFVVVMDATNPLLETDRLCLKDIAEAPNVVGDFGAGSVTPPLRLMGEKGLDVRTAARVSGYQTIPMLVERTDLVAVVPRMLAARLQKSADIAIVELDSSIEIPIVEAMFWHPTQTSEPAHVWLRRLICDAFADLDAGSDYVIHPVRLTG